jgi:hypothetical protein
MDKLDMKTPNMADKNFEKLSQLFPNAITETITGYDEDGNAIIKRAVDADVLRQEITAEVIGGVLRGISLPGLIRRNQSFWQISRLRKRCVLTGKSL